MIPENKYNGKSSNSSTILDIPTRLQWENGHGFCGETCIQACSLFNGSYISQLEVRKIAGGQILVGENAEPTIRKLGYQIEVWNNQRPKPQYKEYLQWIKKMITEGYPVIIVGYQPDGEQDQYDHIYLAIGVKYLSISEYNDEDTLVYMDLFDEDLTETKFGKVWDTKGMKGNGKDLDFAIPKNVDYGIAFKGIKDPQEQFLPVRINLEEKAEPNVSMGEQPKEFKIEVVVSELEVGKRYVLLRYDNFKALPVENVQQAEATSVDKFVAQSTTFKKKDAVKSNKSVFFRCIEEEDLN